MSEGVLPPSDPFTRGSRARASLPAGRTNSQSGDRTPGLLYLQYGEEVRQVQMPADVVSYDALLALFITAFPQQLTMKMLQSPNMVVCIRDTSRNVYYDLEDVRNIPSHSYLKLYHKDATHVFSRHARSASAEGRISKEVLYGNHTLSSSTRSTLHSLQGPMSPPTARSMPSSPSRMAYSTGSAGGLADPGSAAVARGGLSGAGRSAPPGSSSSSSSSAILKRRDVRPDEDFGSSRSLMARGDGGPYYPDSYCSSIQDGASSRLSIVSSQCSAPPSLAADVVNCGHGGIPGGLQQYRASVTPLPAYGDITEHHGHHSLHRQKNRLYGDGQLPPMGTKTRTPSPSPYRGSEARMIDGQIMGGAGLVASERMSPLRRSFRRDSNGAMVEIVNRSRGSRSSSSSSSVFVDSPLGHSERQFQGHVTVDNPQRERMRVMEDQIASLAGLVHHALTVGPDKKGTKDIVSENDGQKLHTSRHGSSSDRHAAAHKPVSLPDGFSPAPLVLQAPPPHQDLQQSLALAKRHVSDLRVQINQLRQQQLENQEAVSSMLKMARQKLLVQMRDRLAQPEEEGFRRRSEMEEERIRYLAMEDRILTQLSELEDHVDGLQTKSASGQPSITLREVEEGVVNLRRVGEALAVLKGEVPELQAKMRSVLRVEVEAVRFLKEEPHKMDSMLKRVKVLTEALGSLRRCVSEATPPSRSAQLDPLNVLETNQGPLKTQSPQHPPKPQPQPLPPPSSSGIQSEVGLAGPPSPLLTRKTKIQPSHHHPSPPLTPTHGRDSPTVAKVSPRSREGSPALQKKPLPLHAHHQTSTTTAEERNYNSSTQHTTTHPETTERQTGTGRRDKPRNTISTSTRTSTSTSQPPPFNTITPTDLDQVLREAQACLMESIPDLDMSDNREVEPSDPDPDPTSGQTPAAVSPSQHDAILDQIPQGPVQQTFLSYRQVEKAPEMPDKVDSPQLKLSDTVSQPPAASVEPPSPSASPSALSSTPHSPPPSAAAGTECSRRSLVEKLQHSSMDKEVKQSPDKTGKSPPPPPPKPRLHAVSPALTTGRSREVIFTTRKEPVGAQDELPVVPQPKPPRQPPKVKPKPQKCPSAPRAASTSPPAPADMKEEQEQQKEEEDDKFMNQQVTFYETAERSHENTLPGGNKQCKGEGGASPTTNQNAPHLTPSQQLAPQTGPMTVCADKHVLASEAEEPGEDETEVEQEVFRQVESPSPAAGQEHRPDDEETSTAASGQTEKTTSQSSPVSPDQVNEEVSPNPASAEKTVKLTTTVKLQKANVSGPDQTSEKPVKQAVKEKKSNLTVVLTLQKQSSLSEDFLNSVSPDQDRAPPVLRPATLPLRSADNQQNQETKALDSPGYREEGGSLSPEHDDEGPPPPPPPTGKINLQTSKTRAKTRSNEAAVAKANSSDTQVVPGEGADDPTHENHGGENDDDDFDKKPIIVIINDAADSQAAYKRLSTILECEEDLDEILSPVSIVDEDEMNQEEEEQDLGKLGLSDLNTECSLTEITTNGQNSPPPSESLLLPVPEDQRKPDPLKKSETKKKFKFKFPKTKLAAFSQAIRTGSTKPGRKTLEVVVYEEEEDLVADSKPVKDVKRQTRESKRFEIKSSKQHSDSSEDTTASSPTETRSSKSYSRTEELCKNALDSIDSLEESIKQLEISVDSMSSPPLSPEPTSDKPQPNGKVTQERDRSPSKRPAPQIAKGPKPPQSKRAKPQPPPASAKPSTKKQTSSSNSPSSTERLSKSRRSSSSGSPEKTPTGEQNLQATQDQPRLATIPR